MTLPPRFEGTVELPDRRRVGYAEYGPPDGRPILWFHGSPGGRGQIPPVARIAANEMNVRLISLERPGVGASSAYLHRRIADYAQDVRDFTDRLDIERFGIVALSGGGPYALACAHELPDRVVAAAVLGGVAPTRGAEAPGGGVVELTARFQSVISTLREPLGAGLWMATRALRPLANQAFGLYMRMSPEGDQRVFARPEMKAMFIDDIVDGSERQFRAMVYDLVLFGRPWGFAVRDITRPIRFWHGDSDHIVPLAHGKHLAELVPDSELRVRHGESHLGSLDAAEEILDILLQVWRRDEIDQSVDDAQPEIVLEETRVETADSAD
ncbi:MAG: Alpha/beta hydrolase [Actinomycetia bacterium]|nr:Alpha/beta hydrolase [Actinomycetes bacterium]